LLDQYSIAVSGKKYFDVLTLADSEI